MDFFEVIKKRRSIRRFTEKPVPEQVLRKAFETAILAPNSSNVQTWNFYHVKSAENKAKLVEACLSQSAARTASDLVVIVASPKSWRRSQPGLIQWVEKVKAPEQVQMYYRRLVPSMYMWGIFNSLGFIKWISFTVIGLFRPIVRGATSKSSIQEISIKSAALAAENFVLAISAQGYATCMMEGFDECRVRKLLQLERSERVVMVIGVGEESERGTWGEQYRMPLNQVLHQI